MLAVPGCGCAVCDGRRGRVAAPLPEGVVVLVGPPAAGKSTLRRRLVRAGLDVGAVVSLDDLRREFRAADLAAGAPPRDVQDYSLRAARRAARRGDALAALGVGYVADATHLRRAERREHVRRARDTDLPAEAVLLPDVPLLELLQRNATRPPDERVPEEVLGRFAHRRSLLGTDLLRDEGFAVVHAPAVGAD